jgi:general secretion pathway protein G
MKSRTEVPGKRIAPDRGREIDDMAGRRMCMRPRYRALTLVELMVVIVILGILATTVTVTVRDHLVTGKQNAAKQEMSQISTALELFYMENNRYPTNDEGLGVLLEHNERHPDGLLHGGDLDDPWGRPYQYVYPGLHGTFDLVCYGADGAEGGSGADADIQSWNMK